MNVHDMVPFSTATEALFAPQFVTDQESDRLRRWTDLAELRTKLGQLIDVSLRVWNRVLRGDSKDSSLGDINMTGQLPKSKHTLVPEDVRSVKATLVPNDAKTPYATAYSESLELN